MVKKISHQVDLERTIALQGLQMVKIDTNSSVAGVVRDQVHQRTLHPRGRRDEVATFPRSPIRRLNDDDGHIFGVSIPGKRGGEGSDVPANVNHVPTIPVLPTFLAVHVHDRVSSGDELLFQHCEVL